MYFADGDAPSSTYDEELSCDRFGIDFIIGNIAGHGEDSEPDLKRKRCIAIALGLSMPILIATSLHWGQTRSHPSVRERFEQLVSLVDLPDSDRFWIFSSALVIARLRAEKKPLESIRATNAKQLLLAVVAFL
jgi:hypothetical protein